MKTLVVLAVLGICSSAPMQDTAEVAAEKARFFQAFQAAQAAANVRAKSEPRQSRNFQESHNFAPQQSHHDFQQSHHDFQQSHHSFVPHRSRNFQESQSFVSQPSHNFQQSRNFAPQQSLNFQDSHSFVPQESNNHVEERPRWTGPFASTVPAAVDGQLVPVEITPEVAAARESFFNAYQLQLEATKGFDQDSDSSVHNEQSERRRAPAVQHHSPSVQHFTAAPHHTPSVQHHNAVQHHTPSIQHHNTVPLYTPSVQQHRSPSVQHHNAIQHHTPSVQHHIPSAQHHAPAVTHFRPVQHQAPSVRQFPSVEHNTPQHHVSPSQHLSFVGQQHSRNAGRLSPHLGVSPHTSAAPFHTASQAPHQESSSQSHVPASLSFHELTGQVLDTPEVASAKASFFKTFQEHAAMAAAAPDDTEPYTN